MSVNIGKILKCSQLRSFFNFQKFNVEFFKARILDYGGITPREPIFVRMSV